MPEVLFDLGGNPSGNLCLLPGFIAKLVDGERGCFPALHGGECCGNSVGENKMNRRNFFSSLAAFASAASISPQIFIPKFEAVKWNVKRVPMTWDFTAPFGFMMYEAESHFKKVEQVILFGREKRFYFDGNAISILD